LSEWLGRVQLEVLFWSSLGVVYDSDIGRFQGHRTSPAPPSLPAFAMFAPAHVLTNRTECAAGTVEQPRKKTLARVYHILIPKHHPGSKDCEQARLRYPY